MTHQKAEVRRSSRGSKRGGLQRWLLAPSPQPAASAFWEPPGRLSGQPRVQAGFAERLHKAAFKSNSREVQTISHGGISANPQVNQLGSTHDILPRLE